MDIKKEVEALDKELGLLEKKTPLSNTSVSVTIARCHPIEISSATAVIPEKEAVRIENEGTVTSQFLEDEICDNIYMSCLARVATMSLAERRTAEGMSQAAKEWDAVEKKAKRDIAKLQRILEKARVETLEAKGKLDLTQPHVHGEDAYKKAHHDYEVRKLSEELASARVATAEATLFAIEVRDTAQSDGAADDIKEALGEEKAASDALDAATAPSFKNLYSCTLSATQPQIAPVLPPVLTSSSTSSSSSSNNSATSQNNQLADQGSKSVDLFQKAVVSKADRAGQDITLMEQVQGKIETAAITRARFIEFVKSDAQQRDDDAAELDAL
ncbi:MAG: hypothetical protein A3F67_07090 [Verrucomicrobia bacterium RIFCSPHIGHO2_12_FULL_41_10]|nr:MAG: hypothetical protein A3F67_07090 [Verrucomicrobia bacterium RIFCSPHIGHO2_12_FULL_41_10]HLB34361.1 hypothetical protein [Chthoniobacterales bacterium]